MNEYSLYILIMKIMKLRVGVGESPQVRKAMQMSKTLVPLGRNGTQFGKIYIPIHMTN